jgi:uncharacterized membrane protein
MLQKLLYQIRSAVEHQLKHFGFYTGLLIASFAALLWFVDVQWGQQHYKWLNDDNYASLWSLNGTLATVLISILLTTFSVVFVVMQLASSQFSPRILRYFMYSDMRIQQFIGLFLGAISFVFLPQVLNLLFTSGATLQLTAIVAVVLCLYCLMVSFPTVISHLSDNMNVATIAHRIKKEVIDEVEVLYPDHWQPTDPILYKRPKTDANAQVVPVYWRSDSGYLSEVNYKKLREGHADFVAKYPECSSFNVYQRSIVGEFVMAHATVILSVGTTGELSPSQRTVIESEWQQIAAKSFKINKFRSYTQDINFGVRKLVDVAIKAISPAVNDPTTCINCIDHLGEIVNKVATRRFPSSEARSLNSKQILINEFNFDELVDFCFGQICQWGKKDPVVVKRLIKTIRQIIPGVRNPYHLMVLIREIEDMELGRIYNLENTNREHTAEQIETVLKERQKFTKTVADHIAWLESDGVLAPYAHVGDDLTPIQRAESECIAFLREYQTVCAKSIMAR